jgi:hypothetical protein
MLVQVCLVSCFFISLEASFFFFNEIKIFIFYIFFYRAFFTSKIYVQNPFYSLKAVNIEWELAGGRSLSDYCFTRDYIFIWDARGGNRYFNVRDQIIMVGTINYIGGQTFWSHFISKNIHRTDILIHGVDNYIRLAYKFVCQI